MAKVFIMHNFLTNVQGLNPIMTTMLEFFFFKMLQEVIFKCEVTLKCT